MFQRQFMGMPMFQRQFMGRPMLLRPIMGRPMLVRPIMGRPMLVRPIAMGGGGPFIAGGTFTGNRAIGNIGGGGINVGK